MTRQRTVVWLWGGFVLSMLSVQVSAQVLQPEKKSADKAPPERRDAPPAADEPRREDPGPGRRPPRPDFFGPDERPPGFGRPDGPPDGRGGPGGQFPPGGRPDGQPGFGRPPRDEGRFGGRGGQPDVQRLEEMKKYDPEMYELEKQDQDLERETIELSQQLRRAGPDQRDQIKKNLQTLVQKHFDARQARRELQLKRLESELERMRESMKRRTEAREQIVGRRVSELSGEQNEFDF